MHISCDVVVAGGTTKCLNPCTMTFWKHQMRLMADLDLAIDTSAGFTTLLDSLREALGFYTLAAYDFDGRAAKRVRVISGGKNALVLHSDIMFVAGMNAPLTLGALLGIDKATLNQLDDEFAETALHAAASKGLLPNVQVLVQHGAELMKRDYEDETPFMVAAKMGYDDVVEWFLRQCKNFSAVRMLVGAQNSSGYCARKLATNAVPVTWGSRQKNLIATIGCIDWYTHTPMALLLLELRLQNNNESATMPVLPPELWRLIAVFAHASALPLKCAAI